MRSPATDGGDEGPAGLHIVQIQEATARRLPAAPSLDTVDFVDRRHGWAGGAVILATTNGGHTWHRQSSPATTVDVLDFVNRREGWVLGSATVGRAATVTPLLLRTTDGGRHWHRAAEPRLALHGTRATVHPLQRVQFTDPSLGAGVAGPGPNAYYGGPGSTGTAVITTDGGETWHALPTPAAVSSLCFANRRVGWAVVAGKGIVLRTTDSGRSWRRILPDGASGATFFINGGDVSCVSASTAWVLLYGGTGMMQQTYGLYRTADAGAHWTVVAARTGIGGYPAPGTPGIPVKAARAAPLRSAPGTAAGPLAVVNGTTAYLGGPSPVDNTFALGGTSDGGRTWRIEPPVAGLSPILGLGLSFVSARQGWLATSVTSDIPTTQTVASTGVILATGDGGRTWQRQYPGPAVAPALAISFPTVRVGYGLGTLGDGGALLRTMDGGHHWQRVATLPPSRYEPQFFPPSLSFVTPRRGWTVAGNGHLLVTADGGRMWRTIAVPPARSRDDPQGLLDAVAFVDHRHGCVQTIVVPPRYVGTSDGGAHWRPVLGVTGPAACAARLAGYPVAAALQQAQRTLQPHDWAIFAGVTSPRQGWDLVNHCEGTSTGRYLGPYLLASADAGRTWREFPWDNAFWCIPQSLSFATAADGWLLMRGNSHLYRTTDGGASWHQSL